MIIEWEQHTLIKENPPFSTLGDACMNLEGITIPLHVHVLITDDEEIHQINRQYRQIDRSTDVLSFPAVMYPEGETAGSCEKLLRREFDPEEKACRIGDIIISYPHACKQAEEYGHSVMRELCYLFVHAVFHLFGFDHIDENDRKEMRIMEEKALHMVGIMRDDESPVSDEELLALAREARKYSYSPYSHYAVGAALLCSDGRVYQGCNVENASYGVTNCAERTALFKAVSEGERSFIAIAIAAEGTAPYPCGACRQALNEFSPDMRVLVTWDGKVEKTTLSFLLPSHFISL